MDFMILEPKPFNSKWYLHKFKGLGVRYKVVFAFEWVGLSG